MIKDILNAKDIPPGGDIRSQWEKAKKEGRLTGCGLMGNLTMDDIEELKGRVETAMSEWARLAGNIRFRSLPDNPVLREAELRTKVNDLEETILQMKFEIAKLRKEATKVGEEKDVVDKAVELTKPALDSFVEAKTWIELTE